MSAFALLGGLSGGQGGQKLGGDAGPATSGPATSGGSGGGGLQFNTGNAAPDYTMPAIVLALAALGYAILRRKK